MSNIIIYKNDNGDIKLDEEDYISITDIAKYKNDTDANDIIRNWLRNRNTIEFLGIWEQLNNQDFKPVEFDGFRKEAGLNSFTMSPTKWIKSTNAVGIVSKAGRYGGTYADILNVALFGMTAKQWRDNGKNKKGNIRDEAKVSQLVCLSNLESLNAHFINEGLSQSRRLQKLNSIAIGQIKILSNQNTKKPSMK